jgi:hypothetical protein
MKTPNSWNLVMRPGVLDLDGTVDMVEAGGVEPPSEKVRNEENYVRFRFIISASRFRAGKKGDRLVRLGFSRQLRTEALGQSRKMTLTHRRAGSAAGAATYLIKQRMQTACWQLCFSDRFTGARNPARLPITIRSRRIRYAPKSVQR